MWVRPPPAPPNNASNSAPNDSIMICTRNIDRLANRLFRFKNSSDIRKFLLKNGFKLFDSGAYKHVYSHDGEYKKWVAKVYKIQAGRDCGRLPKHLRRYWLRPIYRNRLLMIQQRVDMDYPYEAHRKLRSSLGLYADSDDWAMYDLNDDNIGLLNGRPKIIDYSGY